MKLSGILAAAGLTAAIFGQQAQQPRLPADHPEIRSSGRRAELAALTESLSAGGTAAAAPAVRRNFIDDYIFDKIERGGIPHAPPADDATFMRRVFIDLTGRIPSGEEARAFAADDDPQKHDKLIDKLVGGVDWRDRWTHWHLDLWRTSQNRVGWAGRNLFHDYIADALLLNQPYDELARELLTAEARSNWYVGPASYLVRWAQFADNCTEIMHEDTADEMTVMMFKHFMGIDLQCVSCHDGANHLEQVNVWLTERKREELWAQAAFFGNTRVLRRIELRNTQDEYRIDDKDETRAGYSRAAPSTVRAARLGAGLVPPRFILNGEAPEPGKPLRQELARMFTAHPQFARGVVNRFWAEFMGVGIVDPADGFDLARMDPDNLPENRDLQPTHPDLLERLAQDFIDSGYDLQRLHKTIAKSSAYRLSSSFPAEWKPAYAKYFARKFARRMSSEQIYDAVVKATDLHTPIGIRLTDKTVNYMVQMHGPADLKRAPNLDPKTQLELQFFAESFGQANREFNEPKRGGSIIQAALMMNSRLVKEKAKPLPGSYLAKLLAKDAADEEVVDALFWRFLTRGPDAGEKDAALTLLADRGREGGGEDLQWLLMNKMEFFFHR